MSESIINLDEGASKWLRSNDVRERIGNALGGWMTGEEFTSQMLIAFQTPAIKATSPKSQYEAAHTCASLQLVPTLGHVALIPRNNTVDGMKVNQCTVMVQWQGYHAIMMRNAEVMDIEARLVIEGDEFEFDGTKNEVLYHQYDPFDEKRKLDPELKNLRGGYLVITFVNGSKKYHLATGMHIRKSRACAQTKTIWNQWAEQMALKTIYRDAYARRVVPIDPLVEQRLKRAVDLDDKTLDNQPTRPPQVRHSRLNAPSPKIVDGSVTEKPEAKKPKSKPKSKGKEAPKAETDSKPSEKYKTDESTESAARSDFRKCKSMTAITQAADAMIKDGASASIIEALAEEYLEALQNNE